MRIALTQDSAKSLYDLLTLLIGNYHPENIAEKLIDDLIRDVYERLRKKVVYPYTKEYAITLNPKEAKAYHIFFNQNRIDTGWVYEQNMVHQHILLIDKIYG